MKATLSCLHYMYIMEEAEVGKVSRILVSLLLNDVSCSWTAAVLFCPCSYLFWIPVGVNWWSMHSDCTLYSWQQLQAVGGLLPDQQANWLKHKRHWEFLWDLCRDQAAGSQERVKEINEFQRSLFFCELCLKIYIIGNKNCPCFYCKPSQTALILKNWRFTQCADEI